MDRRICNKFRGVGVIIALAVAGGFAALVMVLWNGLLPELFGLPPLNYWQALGILALCRILFSGIGGGFFGRRRAHPHFFLGGAHHNPLREKWMNMSDEERKAFMEKHKDFRTMFHDRVSAYNGMREFFDERDREGKNE
ncbi:MAG: hypothetical protein LBT01_07485 [Spirochaetaceae bacterium]|jgi:hypothetical protein|nr:hypothetical protein [Spirochaetaceae bacterium]